jgi:sugar (pentulose or hexulose) kinase
VSDLLLGIDVGTTWCKAVALSADGEQRGFGRARTPWQRVPTGGEVDSCQLAEAAFSAARQAIDEAEGKVVGIGVTSMAEAGALLDASGRPVAPTIAWYDTRGKELAAQLARDLPAFSSHTGLPATSTCTLAKHRWLREHEAFARAPSRWLNVAEWVVKQLGGDEVAELSLASRTGYLDIHERDWWPPAAEWAGAANGFLPAAVIAGTPAGRCGPMLHERATGAVLTVAGHDHLCAAVGAGAVRPGDLLDSCGTAEALVRAIEPPLPDGAVEACVQGGVTVGWHVLWQRWALVGGFPSGKTLEGLDLHSADGRAQVRRLAEQAASLRATIEAVAGPSRRVVACGGWVTNEVFAATKKEVFGDFQRAPYPEAGARGAAILAGVARRVRA